MKCLSEGNYVEPKETVTIPKEKYQELLDRDEWLSCLEAAGVDNWDGIDYAYEILEGDA